MGLPGQKGVVVVINSRPGALVSCPASFHSHAEEKSLVKCLFNFCSVNYDVMLVVYDVFNVAICANDLMLSLIHI